MKKYALKAARITLGTILVIIGIIGGLIPIFQGWIFGIPGLMLLSQDIPIVRKYYERAKEMVEQKREEYAKKKAQKQDQP